MSEPYPLFEARGTPRELGRQHGEQARARIQAFLNYLAHSLRLSREAIRSRALRFLPLFERYCPQLVEEVRGLAEGADVSFSDALAVQIRGELGQVNGEGCTTFVVSARGTAGGQVLIGQNSDVKPELEDLAYVLRLEPEGKPALLTCPIKRLMLEQRTVTAILDLLRRVPVCSSGNYVLCDGEGRIADVELTPEGPVLMEADGEGFLAHTNHFLCGPHACPASDAASVADSFPRLSRMRQLLAGRFGRLTVDDLKRFLADHDGRPTSICRHPHDGPDHASVSARGRTVASLIAEPAEGRLHVTRGNPCEAPYTTYRLRER
ncbi:MAG: hypothetical protein HYS12_21485 [Planctomycetes bacterium]|nr:hypothetical protein [Planctomycetota bacterium]